MKPYLICPTCGSDDVMKNGMTRRGKQNHKCRDCGRQFVENLNLDSQRHRHRAQKLSYFCWSGFPSLVLPESWAFPLFWLLALFEILVRCNRTLAPRSSRKKLENTQSKWMNSGMKVDDKGNKQWVWLAMDTKTREVIGCHIGDRSSKSAQALWDSLQAVSIACSAKIYTDHS